MLGKVIGVLILLFLFIIIIFLRVCLVTLSECLKNDTISFVELLNILSVSLLGK